MLTQKLNKNAHSGSIQGKTGNRKRSLERMDRKKAWWENGQGVKLFRNIHHA